MDDNPNKLSDTFRDQPLASLGPAWDSLWKESFTPWDRGGLSWALNDVLAEHRDLIPAATQPGRGGSSKKALAPGCGRGHDVLLRAAWGYDVYGLDYSSAATARAVENEKTAGGDVVYAARDEAVGKGGVRWVTGDFFSDAWVDGETITAGFDLIFDYTVSFYLSCFLLERPSDELTPGCVSLSQKQFFCALPPSARPKWAARMSQLLAPDGRLVCLQWPSIKPPSEPGPPWGVTPGRERWARYR